MGTPYTHERKRKLMLVQLKGRKAHFLFTRNIDRENKGMWWVTTCIMTYYKLIQKCKI